MGGLNRYKTQTTASPTPARGTTHPTEWPAYLPSAEPSPAVTPSQVRRLGEENPPLPAPCKAAANPALAEKKTLSQHLAKLQQILP